MSAADDPRWDEDPTPSFNELAADIGIEAPVTSPERPAWDVEWQIAAFWPAVPAGVHRTV